MWASIVLRGGVDLGVKLRVFVVAGTCDPGWPVTTKKRGLLPLLVRLLWRWRLYTTITTTAWVTEWTNKATKWLKRRLSAAATAFQGMFAPWLGPAHHDAKLEVSHGPPRAMTTKSYKIHSPPVNLISSPPFGKATSSFWDLACDPCETVTAYDWHLLTGHLDVQTLQTVLSIRKWSYMTI